MRSWFKISWVGKFLLLINIFFAALLVCAYLSTMVPPDDFWPLAFAGLAYPFILLINAAFVFYWIIKKKVFFLVSLIFILLGINHFINTFQWNPNPGEINSNRRGIKVLSYNVRVFDLYNYQPGWKPDFTNRNHIFGFLQQHDFDIICFQEFVHDRSGIFKTLDTIPEIISARYAHFEYSSVSRDINFFGLATFSSHPIINKGRISFSTRGGNFCIYSDIKIGNDTIRVYNLHLESIGLSPEDYFFMEGILRGPEQINYGEGGKRIMQRLKQAYILRASQAREVADHISGSPYPVVLAGDFNDTPVSYVYRQLSQHLEDAFISSSHGFGKTYIGAFPSFRIDYILHSSEFESKVFTTGQQRYSDHFPIYTTLRFNTID